MKTKTNSTVSRLLTAALEGAMGESIRIGQEKRVRRRAFEEGLAAGLERGYEIARHDLQLRAVELQHEYGEAGNTAAAAQVGPLVEALLDLPAADPGDDVVEAEVVDD